MYPTNYALVVLSLWNFSKTSNKSQSQKAIPERDLEKEENAFQKASLEGVTILLGNHLTLSTVYQN